LFWIVNPADYDDVLERFLEPTDFPEHDTYHVIARNAWGDLYLWGEQTGDSLDITPMNHWVSTGQGCAAYIAKGEANKRIELFFAFQEAIDEDTQDENDEPMFESAIQMHGALAENELFAFNPFLFMGGNKTVKDISKENIFVHLNLIADMGDMEVIDMASMISSTLKQHGP
ncbi:GAD-like domain-containing protein, partial [Shewanella colwelliana]|uniref:GAD-like domain-containing protein n=1 Tax=Shewanella colwelliana TaxID=23 RepID=UPI0037371102